jgi:phage terminase large subunit-like protein
MSTTTLGKAGIPADHRGQCHPLRLYREIHRRLGERFNIREIAFDRWGAVQMVQNLEGMGFTVVPFGQGFKDMSPPTKELMKLTLEGNSPTAVIRCSAG